MDSPEEHVRLLAHIRDEMRLEVGVLHDRINALISAEAFLTISFTMALANSGAHAGANIFDAVAPLLSIIGFILAVLAWPGVNTGFKILVEWNALLLETLHAAPAASRSTWRPSVLKDNDRRTMSEHRSSMLFARAVPVVFAVAWATLTAIALIVAGR